MEGWYGALPPDLHHLRWSSFISPFPQRTPAGACTRPAGRARPWPSSTFPAAPGTKARCAPPCGRWCWPRALRTRTWCSALTGRCSPRTATRMKAPGRWTSAQGAAARDWTPMRRTVPRGPPGDAHCFPGPTQGSPARRSAQQRASEPRHPRLSRRRGERCRVARAGGGPGRLSSRVWAGRRRAARAAQPGAVAHKPR